MLFGYRIKYYKNILNNAFKKTIGNGKLEIDYDNAVLFLLACDYNNVGDILIREAQEVFLKRNMNKKRLVVIGYSDTCKYLRDIKKNVTRNTIVVLTGGGNTGDRYCGTDNFRNYVIKSLRKKGCKIIGFPQTIEYSNTEKGSFYLKKAKKAYSSNNNFVLFAREKKSYELARDYFKKTKVCLAPDIVLSHDTIVNGESRCGIGLLIRKDSEKVVDDAFWDSLFNHLNEKHKIVRSDMLVSNFKKARIKEYMNQKISFVSKRELVLTDRLHGMILCFITDTPCVVFPNANHKIKETYTNWLYKRQNFIKLEEKMDYAAVLRDIRELMNLKCVKKEVFLDEFNTLKEELTMKDGGI